MIRRLIPLHTVILFGLLAAAIPAAAQPPTRDRPDTPRAATGTIRGRIIRADTGQPLRRAQVRIDEWDAKSQSGPRSTMTDAQGRYELGQLPAGTYHLKAARGGFVEIAYGQRRPFEKGRPVELAEGAVLQNVDFALPPGGVVTGRVLDELGEPVAQASVSLARRQFVDGVRKLVGRSGSSTDDRGEFRLFGVPPGQYVLIAKLDVDFGSADRVRYVPTYYPGTAVAAEAARIAVSAGQEVSGLVVTLARGTTATVRGVVRSSGQAAAGPFTMVHAREIGGAGTEGHGEMAIPASDGSFTLGGLLPGTYMIEAQSMSAGPAGSASASASASREVTVDGTDVSGVTLVLSEGSTARGKIRFDTVEPPQGLRPSEVFVMPALIDPPTMHLDMGMGGGLPVARDDWSFEVKGLRGRGFIRAGTADGWEMKRVRRGNEDVTDTPLDFSADIDDLVIELTRETTTVSGGVSDDRSKPVLDATVVLFADDPEKWGPHSRFIESARLDQRGRFSITSLPPGKYVAIAIGYLEPGEERDPDLLEEWRPRGTRFTLVTGETRTLDLRLSGS